MKILLSSGGCLRMLLCVNVWISFFPSSEHSLLLLNRVLYIKKRLWAVSIEKVFLERMLCSPKNYQEFERILGNGAGRREAKQWNHTPESVQWRHSSCYWTQDAKASAAGHHCETTSVAMETLCCCRCHHWLNGFSTVPAFSESRSGPVYLIGQS